MFNLIISPISRKSSAQCNRNQGLGIIRQVRLGQVGLSQILQCKNAIYVSKIKIIKHCTLFLLYEEIGFVQPELTWRTSETSFCPKLMGLQHQSGVISPAWGRALLPGNQADRSDRSMTYRKRRRICSLSVVTLF